MTGLHIHTLGQFQVTLDGMIVDNFNTDKVRALLIYLAIENRRPHRREHLAGLLWSDQPERRALHNLRQALSGLRKVLGDDLSSSTPSSSHVPYLTITRETVQFNPESAYWLDVETFNCYLRDAFLYYQHRGNGNLNVRRLQQAVRLFGGHFLDQFSLNGASLFEEWVMLIRENLDQHLIEALSYLADYFERRQEYTLARQAVTRIVDLSPWVETAQSSVMRLLAMDGQWNAAQTQYHKLQRYLAETLCVEPSPETIQLYEEIRLAAQRQQSLPSRFPPSRHNLPSGNPCFVGRETELDELSSLVADPNTRLITLFGEGGIGKTRLALESAHAQVGIFRDGVFWVSLVHVETAEQFIPAIADAVGMAFLEEPELRKQMLDYLQPREMLIVLDNFEHLLPRSSNDLDEGDKAVRFILEVIKGCPGIKFIVTSRVLLNLHMECVVQVAGLNFPSEAVTSPDRREYSALSLFEQQALRVHPRFSLPQEWEAVSQICRLLDGVPLAIELAAAWTRHQTCQEIAEQIETDLDFLFSSMLDVPERHRSLRSVFEHSWRLLLPEEQGLLKGVSVFMGSFSTEAAIQVVNADPRQLETLVDRSLLRQIVPGRFELHNVIKQFASEKLDDFPESAFAARQRHAFFFTNFLAQRVADLKSAAQSCALNEIARDLENARSAWMWRVYNDHSDDLALSAEALYHFFNIRARFEEGLALFARAAAELEEDPACELVLAKTLACLGALAFRTYNNALSRTALERSRAIYECRDAQDGLAFCQVFLAGVYHRNRQYEQALQIAERSLEYYQRAGDPWGQSYSLYILGLLDNKAGQLAESRRKLLASLEAARTAGDQRRQIAPLNILGDIACHEGDYTSAEQYFEESLSICRELGDRHNRGMITLNLGTVYHYAQQYQKARLLYHESMEICREIGDLAGQAMAVTNLGELAIALGNLPEAIDFLQQGLSIARSLDDDWCQVACLSHLGEAKLGLGDFSSAGEYLMQAIRLANEIQSPLFTLLSLLYLAKLYLQTGQQDQAHEFLSLIVQHEGAEDSTRQTANQILAELGWAVIPETALSLEAVIQQLLT